MCEKENNHTSIADPLLLQLEYKEACTFIRTELNIRRVALLFVVTVEWGIFTLWEGILAGSNQDLNHILICLLPAIGFLIVLIGLHNELRIKAYTDEYSSRARDLEKRLGITLLSTAYENVAKSRLIGGMKSQWLFVFLYVILLAGWGIIVVYQGLFARKPNIVPLIAIVATIIVLAIMWLCHCCKTQRQRA